MTVSYEQFLENRRNIGCNSGFDPIFLPDYLFDFQKYLVEWAIRKGRGALFEDCGLGKTVQQLVWARNIFLKTGKPVLIAAPLAVSLQTSYEAEKFGLECVRSTNGKVTGETTITNYQKLHLFNPNDYSGVVCDESSILKSFDGKIKDLVTNFMRKVPYRLLATATAAPNDYIELGTSSEALGNIGFIDMLNRFFKNDNNNTTMRRMYGETPKYRLKGHAEIPFWQWVTSWAIACRKPSDLGFEDGAFILPELIENNIIVKSTKLKEGCLLPVHAATLPEQREEKRRTIEDRCNKVFDLVNGRKDQCVIWCHLNDESKYLKNIIPDSVEITGSDSDEKKEETFISFSKGEVKRIITKPKIGAWGMNWQNCHHTITFVSHSYEQYYQAVRRFWRFGQKNNVEVDVVMSEGEDRILKNLIRKNDAAIKMFENLVAVMNKSITIKKNHEKIEWSKPKWIK
jgi:predicted transposase YbfD/YdcC